MKNIKIKKKYVVLAVLTLIVAVGTVSLAYLQGSVINDLINNTKVTTGNVDVKISDASVNVSDIKPLYTSNSDYGYEDADFVKKFSIENADGNLNACVKLYMKIDSIDSLLANKYFRYVVVNDETGTTISGSFNGASSGNDLELGSLYFIESNKSKKYTMYIWIEYDSSVDQMAMLNKSMSGTLYVKATDSKTKDACDERGNFRITYVTYGGSGCSDTSVAKGESATLCTPTKDNQEFKGWFTDSKYTNQVLSITNMSDDIKLYAKWNCPFSGTLTAGTEYYTSQYVYRYQSIGGSRWFTTEGDGWGVMLKDSDSDSVSNPGASTDPVTENMCIYIGDKPVIHLGYAFINTNAKSIDLSNMNTSNIMEFNGMFSGSKTESIDLGNFDTSSATNMADMFRNTGFKFIKGLNKFDTSNITDMSYMFYGSNATSIDISNFNTRNVTRMDYMFSNSKATKIKGLNSFNTSSVTNMYEMFSNSSAKTIDVSSFDVSKAYSLEMMFKDTKATEIKGLDKWDTSEICNMSYLFAGGNVTSLDLSNFDTSSVTNMSYMFYNASNLKTIYVSDKFVLDNATSSSKMFEGATKLAGSAGTTYDSANVDKTYARADGGTSSPGYFTLKSN